MRRDAGLRCGSTCTLWVFVAAIWGGGLALYLPVVRDLSPVLAPFRISWWALALAFAATEIFVAHLKYRRDAQTYSLSEVPLLIGLCFATPSALVLGRLVGALFALTVIRRQSGLKLAFNLGLFLLLDGCVAPLIFLTLLDSRPPLHPLGWLAAYAAIVTIDALSGLAIALATLLHEGSLPASAVRRDLAFGLLIAVANTSFGLVAVSTLWYNPTTFLLLFVVTAIMFLAYRGYLSLTAMYDRLAKLFAFTSSSGPAISTVDLPDLMLKKLRDAVSAGYVELTLFGDRAESVLRWVDDDELQSVEMPIAAALTADEYAFHCQGSVLLDDVAALALVRADLVARGLTEIMLGPLRDGDRLAGSVLAGSRSGVGAFDQEDLSAFQTLANHLAVMLKNARLVERLRAEVAEREHQALHDPLTDLPNRRAFLTEVEHSLTSSEASREPFALVLLNLAGFRHINDTLGHQFGDRALVELGHRLSEVSSVTCPAHLGGDEFAFLVPGPLQSQEAAAVGSYLRDIIARPVSLGPFTAQLRANVGVVMYPDNGDSAELLLQHADMALQAAKETPQGLVLFADEHDTSSPRRLALATELERAVSEREICVVYQPEIDLRDGRVVAVEALARWRHERLGDVTPEEFVPIAENVGVVMQLTQSVLRQALSETRRWLSGEEGLRLNLNLSVRCLHYPELCDILAEALRAAHVQRAQLVLELTETSLMADFGRFKESVQELAREGFRLSIDDFGVGYSSLAYVKALPITEVKIDRSFVGELLESPETAAVVKSIIDLAHAVGARAVAEGVEDRSTLQRLRAIGCDVAQGFFLSRPMTPEAFRIWLPENEAFFQRYLSAASDEEERAAARPRLVPLAAPIS